MKTLQLKSNVVKQIKQGQVLLHEEDVCNGQVYHEGDDVTLIDATTKQFVAKAIIGYQNKGIGWVYTLQKEQSFNETFILNTLQQAINKRQKMNLDHTSAYRLFNGESDGIGGLVIDWYNDSAIFSWYSQGIYHYKAIILKAFNRCLNQEVVSIFEKKRFKTTENPTQWVQGKQDDYRVIVENDVKYATYLNDGLMSGIFLDQRDVRQYIKEHVKNKTLLNTFSYTAAFSVAAAKGGVKQTVSVDVAKRSIDKSQEHFKLNNIDMATHQLYVMDVFDYFKYAQKKSLLFDWVILDPPSFARTKKRTFSVLQNYGELLQDAIKVTQLNGRIVVSTNASNFSKTAVKIMIDKAFKQQGVQYVIEKEFSQPDDFTTLPHISQTAYLKVFIVRKVYN